MPMTGKRGVKVERREHAETGSGFGRGRIGAKGVYGSSSTRGRGEGCGGQGALKTRMKYRFFWRSNFAQNELVVKGVDFPFFILIFIT